MRARMTDAFAASHGKYVERLSGIALGGKEAKTVAILIPSALANLPDEVRLGRIEIALDDETWLGAKHHDIVRQYVFDLINTGRAIAHNPPADAVVLAEAAAPATPVAAPAEPKPEEDVSSGSAAEPKPEGPEPGDKDDGTFEESEIKRSDLEVLPMKQLRKTAKDMGIKINATWARSKVIDKIMEAVA